MASQEYISEEREKNQRNFIKEISEPTNNDNPSPIDQP